MHRRLEVDVDLADKDLILGAFLGKGPRRHPKNSVVMPIKLRRLAIDGSTVAIHSWAASSRLEAEFCRGNHLC
jgi:hypothetical protein